jgi:hypothetical protein
MAFRSRAIQQEKNKILKKPRNNKKKTNDNAADLEKMLLNNVDENNVNEGGNNDLSILDMLPSIENQELGGNNDPANMLGDSNTIQENNANVNPINENEIENIVVGENVASKINSDTLKKMSAYLIELVEKDQEQKQPWLETIQEYKKYLCTNASLSVTENNTTNNVFDKFKVVDTTMATEIFRIWSVVTAEILPPEGCAGYSIDNPNDIIEEIAKEITDSINNYLIYEDEGFYHDFRTFVYSFFVYGCGLRKMYLDPISKKIITRFISPEDFLIDKENAINGRITHIKYLTKREIIFNINKGVFIDNDLTYLNSSKEVNNEAEAETKVKQENIDSKFMFYEIHDYLNVSEFENDDAEFSSTKKIPLPYVITICAKTLNIVSFISNWKNDENFTRINPFFFYKCFSGLDEYGTSLISLIGANAKVLTALSRAVLDNVALNIQPAGFMISNNPAQRENKKTTFDTSPGTFQQIDTGNMPLQEVFQQFQYNPTPSIVFDIIQSLKNEIKETSSIALLHEGELDQNIPATLSLIERKNKMLSGVMMSIHSSFTREIQALYKALFPVESQNPNIKIKLNSSPSIEGSTQRLVKAQALLDIAMKAPEVSNLKEAVKLYYEALGIDEKKISLLVKNDEENGEEKPDPLLEIQQRQLKNEEKELELKMMEIQTRQMEAQVRLKEIESKERIADKQLERDGYIAALEDEFRKLKLNQETYVADTKNLTNKEIEANKMMVELEKINAETQSKDKILELKEKDRISKEDLALLKMQTEEKEKEIKDELEFDRSVLLSE